MADGTDPDTGLQISNFIGAGIGFIGVLVGSWIANNSARRLERSRSQQSVTTGLFDEFHQNDMNGWRSATYSAFTGQAGNSFADVYTAASDDQKKSMSMFFHYLEKVAALREAGLVDDKLLKSILGRYFKYWFDEVIDPMGDELAGSEWAGMLAKVKKLKPLTT